MQEHAHYIFYNLSGKRPKELYKMNYQVTKSNKVK